MNTLGANIKFLRKLKGISQQKLANEVGLKRNNIASYESSAVEPRAVNFLKLARYFEVDPVQLFTKDLSQELLPSTDEQSEDKVTLMNLIINQLEDLVTETNETQKIVDGFRELQRFRAENSKSYSELFPTELINLIDIVENLLEANWRVVHKEEERGEDDSEKR
ncbi:MAG: helix-turn-helix transcriptional regulator [Bacteroidota bacterium]